MGAIIEDGQGFLWFGTHDGLLRYDGYRVRQYRHDPGNANSLSANYVLAMVQDRDGHIWVAANQYLDRYDPITDSFTHYEIGDSKGQITHLAQDRSGMLWIATTYGLHRMDPRTGHIDTYQHRTNDPSSIADNMVLWTFQQHDGTFWVATPYALDVFDPATGRAIQRVPMNVRANARDPIQLEEDHAGTLWVVSSSPTGLARYDKATRSLHFYATGEAVGGVRCIREDKSGALWLGTHNGLLRFDPQRRRFTHYRSDPGDPESFYGERVEVLFEDHEGGMWAGTSGAGLIRFATEPLPFRRFRFERYASTRPNGKALTNVHQDSRGELWIATRASLLRFDANDRYLRSYEMSVRPGEHDTYVTRIAEDRSGCLWFGTSSAGLRRFDPTTGSFESFRHNPADPNSLRYDSVSFVFVDGRGLVWAGSHDGLNVFDPRSRTFRWYQDAVPRSTLYRVVAEGRDGGFWLGSWNAEVRRFDPATGRFTGLPFPNRVGTLVNAICPSRSGLVWIATGTGLTGFDPATGNFTVYDERSGLPNANVDGVLEDGSGNLWLSTADGLYRFDVRARTFESYSVADGLPANEFYGVTGFRSRTGEMFICSRVGLTRFFPDRVRGNTYVPPVVLSEFQLFARPVPIGGGSPLSRSITLTKSISLTHRQNVFSFEFTALSFANPERNLYRYRLEGLEDKWNQVDANHRFAAYTTLAPGRYEFHVQGSNDRGVWNEEGVKVSLTILPPWWSTWWFRILGAGVSLFAVSSLYRWRVRAIERRNREILRLNQELEQRVRERTAELETANRDLEAFTYSVSHDLRAPLRHVDGFSQILREDYSSDLDPGALKCLTAIQNSTHRMAELIDGLLSLSRCGRRALSLEVTDLNSLVGDVLETLKEEMKGRHIDWKIGRLPCLPCDRTLTRQVFQNLLSNALKFSRQRSPAVIEIGETEIDGRKVIFVRDNGVGFDMRYRDKLFGVFQRLHRQDEFEGNGVGLATVQKIVQKHGGEVWAEAELDKGAAFFFTLAAKAVAFEGEEISSATETP